jgi:hypothetical protein
MRLGPALYSILPKAGTLRSRHRAWPRLRRHHLRFMQPQALGCRVSDEFAVLLCRTHYPGLHRHGDEAAWWTSAGIDAVSNAHRLWQQTRLNEPPIQEHIDPLLGPLTQVPGPDSSTGRGRAFSFVTKQFICVCAFQVEELNGLKDDVYRQAREAQRTD